MKDIPGIKMNQPKGAFYFFPDVSYYFGKSYNGSIIKDATDLCMFLLNEGLVALVSGDAFGNPECLRISYATSEEVLVEAVSRIKKALSLLK
jgi:aspartate aminotransferase